MQVPVMQLSFMSYTNLCRPEICIQFSGVLWGYTTAQLNTERFFYCFLKRQIYVVPIVQKQIVNLQIKIPVYVNPKSLAKHEENKLMKIKVHKESETR